MSLIRSGMPDIEIWKRYWTTRKVNRNGNCKIWNSEIIKTTQFRIHRTTEIIFGCPTNVTQFRIHGICEKYFFVRMKKSLCFTTFFDALFIKGKRVQMKISTEQRKPYKISNRCTSSIENLVSKLKWYSALLRKT